MGRKRDFQGSVVAITGAGSGLGAAFARRFARAGARLVLLDRNAAAVEAVAAELGGAGSECLARVCDVTQEADCQQSMAQAVTRFGGVDVLINNAGITHRSAFADTQSEVFRRVMAVNFFGALYCTQTALPSLRARCGLIIAISSIAGFVPLYGRTGYSASKHACEGLFGSLRSELAGSGTDVLIVCPGFTATGLPTAALDADGRITRHPQSTVGKLAQPEAVADAVFRAAGRSQRRLVLSTVGKLSDVIDRISPRLYEAIMQRSLRGELQRS